MSDLTHSKHCRMMLWGEGYDCDCHMKEIERLTEIKDLAIKDCMAEAAENERLTAENTKLMAVVDAAKTARNAIASLNPDALGEVGPAHDHPGYWIRDELIDVLTKALADLEKKDA